MSRPAYDSAHHRHPGPTADQVSWTVVGVFGDNEMPTTGPGPMTRFAYTVGLADVVGFELWSSWLTCSPRASSLCVFLLFMC